MANKVYINWPVGNYFGAAICGKYLLSELSKLTDIGYIENGFEQQIRTPEEQALVDKHKVKVSDKVEGTVIHSVDAQLKSYSPTWGDKNIAYIFFEWEPLTEVQKENLKAFDLIVAGSEWNAEITRRCGFDAVAIPQGVDLNIFKPLSTEPNRNFIIFSGGKLEPRKGQDIVIAAFKKFVSKYPRAVLAASWHNVFAPDYYESFIKGLANVPNFRVIPLLNHHDMARLMNDTTIGVFPNRCEGGTNLVMMEYLACGKPVIADFSTGQKDVLNDHYAMRVDPQDPIESLIGRLEYAYVCREKLPKMGELAHEAMQGFTWAKTAERFKELI